MSTIPYIFHCTFRNTLNCIRNNHKKIEKKSYVKCCFLGISLIINASVKKIKVNNYCQLTHENKLNITISPVLFLAITMTMIREKNNLNHAKNQSDCRIYYHALLAKNKIVYFTFLFPLYFHKTEAMNNTFSSRNYSPSVHLRKYIVLESKSFQTPE